MNPNTEPSKRANTTADRHQTAGQGEHIPHHKQTEDFGGGHIKSYHGRIHLWLGVVYAVLLVWALYYAYTYWGGVWPGLDY